MSNDSDIRFGRMISENLDSIKLTFYVRNEECHVELPVPGVHNVMNAMAATGVALGLNIPLADILTGLANFKPMDMRMERVQLTNGVQLVNDSYNANPQSVKAALRTVSAAKRAGRVLAVLGDMLELGDQEHKLHEEVGRFAVENGVERLFLIGDLASSVADGAVKAGAKNGMVKTSPDISELKDAVEKEVKTGDIVLIKGSRGMQMERIAEHLKDVFGV